MPAARSTLLLAACFFALYFIWGSTYLFIRIGVQTWPPLLLAGVRFMLAGGLLYGFLRWRGAPRPTRQQWLAGGAIGFLLLSCGNGGVSLAEHAGVSSGVAALTVATVPLFTLIFVMLRGQRTSPVEWAGIAMGMGGIVLLNLGSNLQASPWGALVVLFAAAAWAFGSVWSRALPLPPGAMASAVQMLVGGAICLLGSLLSGERMTQPPGASGWLALAYLTVLGSIVAFSAYTYLLRHVRPAAATSYAYVNPVVAVLLGIAFAGEHIGVWEAAAMGVIVGAVVLIGLPQWRKA
ncbi:drug/metabolite exporter YedA [Pseudomonas sp. NPDC007930]|uniref:drug/metabolite exporter YedA n=1 Tax=Pseudomonas sp. NPDC007930 TaxID=3364417 RepID=UPI0036E55A7C